MSTSQTPNSDPFGLPISIRILLEGLLRRYDASRHSNGRSVMEDDIPFQPSS